MQNRQSQETLRGIVNRVFGLFDPDSHEYRCITCPYCNRVKAKRRFKRNPLVDEIAKRLGKTRKWASNQFTIHADAPRTSVDDFIAWREHRDRTAKERFKAAFAHLRKTEAEKKAVRAASARKRAVRIRDTYHQDLEFRERKLTQARVSRLRRLERDPGYESRKRSRERSTVQGKLRHNLRNALYGLVKRRGVATKHESAVKLVGCTLDELRDHLEKQFERGMNWRNYGRRWHIDHIIPVAKFNLAILDEQKKCFSYLNLRPLWALENIQKSDDINEPSQLPLITE